MTALVVEDEPLVLGVFRTILQIQGFIVLAAETADTALHRCSDRQLEIDLVIVDRRLPAASGIDVALQIRACRPDVLVIVTSGMPLEFWAAEDLRKLSALPQDCYAFLQKPFMFPQLTDTVNELLGRKAALATLRSETGNRVNYYRHL